MRQASMTVSCVAEAKATSSAKAPTITRLPSRVCSAIRKMPAASITCDTSIQPRLRPSRPSTGGLTRSMIGAQRNFNE